ncbi:hypothetical protein [Thauera sp. SDU_THAU2]|uniref:hypothetical protein n=1 Tax=Thauera sp. SDU_THAU2 TaxID=3136633 RepID=UPI00311D860A
MARREGQRAVCLPAPAQMHDGEAVRIAAVAPRQCGEAAAAEGEIGEAAMRRVHRVQHQGGEIGRAGLGIVERGKHCSPCCRRPGECAFEALSVVRQAPELAVVVDHPWRRRGVEFTCAGRRQMRNPGIVLARQRECALPGIPTALTAGVAEIRGAVEEQEAGGVAVHHGVLSRDRERSGSAPHACRHRAVPDRGRSPVAARGDPRRR